MITFDPPNVDKNQLRGKNNNDLHTPWAPSSYVLVM